MSKKIGQIKKSQIDPQDIRKPPKETKKPKASLKPDTDKPQEEKPVGVVKKNQTGRPSTYSDKLAFSICSKMAEGKSLRSICKEPNMPSMSMVFRWLADPRYQSFREHYEESRTAMLEHWADEMLEIADDGSNDTYITEDGDERTNSEVVARSRLRVDTRKWILSKLVPKKYGDKVDVNHGVQPDNPLAELLRLSQGTALPVVKNTKDE